MQHNKTNITVFDVGGRTPLRAAWREYYTGVSAVIYMVDSVNKKDLAVSAEELRLLMEEELLKHVVVLVLANKQVRIHVVPRTYTCIRVQICHLCFRCRAFV